ncbi:hypothetical protein AB6H97_002728 [Providencia rettgeri]
MKSIVFYELNRYLIKIVKIFEPLQKIRKPLMYLPVIYGVLSLFLYCKNNKIQLMDLISIKIITTIGAISIISSIIIIFYVGLCFFLALKNETIFKQTGFKKKVNDVAKLAIYLSLSLFIYLIITNSPKLTPTFLIVTSLLVLPSYITLRKVSEIPLSKLFLFTISTIIVLFIYFLILFSLILISSASSEEFSNIIYLYGITFLVIMLLMTFFKDNLNSSIVLLISGIMLLTPIILQSTFQIKASGLGNEYRCYLTDEIKSLNIPEKFTTPQPDNISKIFITVKTTDVMYIKKSQSSQDFLRITMIPKVEFSCTE